MDIFIALVSILVIAGSVWLMNRFIPFKICPICAGVSGTWIWMLAAALSGYRVNLLVPMMLIGGSVVGISYQLEKRIKFPQPKLWQAVFVVSGFWVGWTVIDRQWPYALVSALCLIIFTYLFSAIPPKDLPANPLAEEKKSTGELEKKIDDCC